MTKCEFRISINYKKEKQRRKHFGQKEHVSPCFSLKRSRPKGAVLTVLSGSEGWPTFPPCQLQWH